MLGFQPLGQFALGQQTYFVRAGAGAFALAGAPVLFTTTLIASPGSFVLTGNAALLKEVVAVGGPIAGGQFTRRRWRELKEAERRRAEELRRSREAKARAERAAAQAAAAAERARKAALRHAEDEAHAARERAQALTDARATVDGITRAAAAVAAAVRLADLSAEARLRQAEQDEEEAIVQLLLAA